MSRFLSFPLPRVLQNHFDECLADGYDSVLVLNLIDKKKDQGKLGIKFEEAAEHFSKRRLHADGTSALQFEWFDFHKQCAKMKWQNLSKVA